MGPNLARVHQVLERIEEISRRCNPEMENIRSQSAQSESSRFVELLDAGKKAKEKKGSPKTNASATVDELREKVAGIAGDYNIDEELIRAVIQVESGWKEDAVSSKGAMGLMQLMPRTAAMLGVDDAFDPEQNVEGGVKYLAQLTDKYDGDVEMALAAYNAGPSRVDAAGGAPFAETARYVKNVMALYHRYREPE